FGLSLSYCSPFNLLPFAIETIEFACDPRRLARVFFEEKTHTEISSSNPAASVDARTQKKSKMPGLGRTAQARNIHQSGRSGMLASPQRNQAFGNKGAIEAEQRHDVGNSAERHKMQERQEVGLGSQVRPEIAPTQLPRHGNQSQEYQSDRSKVAQGRKVVGAVGVNDRDGVRQFLITLVMINHHWVDTAPFGLGKWLEARDAAINGNQQLYAALGERPDCIHIRAVAFKDSIGNMDDRVQPAVAEVTGQQRGCSGAVDIVVAENGNGLVPCDAVRNSRCRRLHVSQRIWIRHQALDGWIEETIDLVDIDIAAGEDARQQFGEAISLRNRQRARRSALIEALSPRPAGQRPFDTKKVAVEILQCNRGDGHSGTTLVFGFQTAAAQLHGFTGAHY